ncbi:hypothetical protein [Streptomyces sp. NBC_00199]|uniref:hypothetical protein n=1 Tax=Streptomyces sp. NBC_00199 TaxID=2975678 RepID=UPI00224EF57E|nr:hypothetical protein [Streptomyces sp. NBC_00199]MCX5262955.1 hypothetical protein [Streptomyces sp. NBC_00199]
MTGTTTLLEARYRAVLRLLPAYYREEREEEMVEVFLGDTDRDLQDQSRPTLGEAASVAALALRARLGTAAAPRRYALLGSAARLFALFAVLLQAAAAVADRALELTWTSTHGTFARDVFMSGFSGQGPVVATAAVAAWVLPLGWTVGYFALLHDRCRTARISVLLAALPTLWPLLAPFVTDFPPPEPAYAAAAAAFAWLPALALCTACHRDAPPAALPAGTPGTVYLGCCVVMGASVVVLPGVVDSVWAPTTCFVLGALGWLVRRGRRGRVAGGEGALALAVLGLLVLTLRVTAAYTWLGVSMPLPTVMVAGFAVQAAALLLLTAALAVVGGRDVAAR